MIIYFLSSNNYLEFICSIGYNVIRIYTMDFDTTGNNHILDNSPPPRGFDTGTARFDLGIPGLAAECVEAMYRSTGAAVSHKDRLPYVCVAVGVLLGIGFGFHRDGMLYGPIGAVIGVVFGLVGGIFVGLVLHVAVVPLIHPESYALKQIRIGNYLNASKSIRRAKALNRFGENIPEPILKLILMPLGIWRSDLPPAVASANLTAWEGILAESVGDIEEAANSYMNALSSWAGHTFVLAGVLELIIREEMWDRASAATRSANKYLYRARDAKVIKTVKDHLKIIEKYLPIDAEPVRKGFAGDNKISGATPVKYLSIRIVENPGSQISNGSLIIDDERGRKALKLAAMPFHLILILAESILIQSELGKDESQLGWVSIQSLLDNLPWTSSNVMNTNVHKLVYKVRSHLAKAGVDRGIVEDNQNGCYRLNVPPESITIEKGIRV